MPFIDDSGKTLDAKISIEAIDPVYSVTFESRGGGRNNDYIPAFTLVLQRLAKLSALIVNAQVLSKEALRLPADLRSIIPKEYAFPLILSPRTNVKLLETRIRAAAAQVGRAIGSKGPGNPTKKVELQFMLPDAPKHAHEWLEDLLSKPLQGAAQKCRSRQSLTKRKN
jgi:hypothetical protein